MFNLDDEQKILRESSDYNLSKSKEEARIRIIHVSALTIETINNKLEKVCEKQDKRKVKSFHEASKHYSR